MEIRTWGYTVLPEGWYSASVSGSDGRFVFRAFPNRGDWVAEGVFKTEAEAVAAGEAFARGEANIPGLYTASY